MTATETWGDLFARAAAYDVSRDTVEQALERRREDEGDSSEAMETDRQGANDDDAPTGGDDDGDDHD